MSTTVTMNGYTSILITDLNKNPEVADLAPLIIENESFVAGGVFRSITSGDTPKDIDVFFYNAGGYNNALERFRNSKKYEPVYHTTRSAGFKHISSDMLIDLVCYQFGTPQEVLNRFDFTICKACLFKQGDFYVFMEHGMFHKHIEERKLVVTTDIENPDLFFNRLIRYVKYGFTDVDSATKLTLFQSIKNRYNDGDQISSLGKEY